MAIKVIYEDKDLLVVNKPAGMVVHDDPPSPRLRGVEDEETVADWLEKKYPEIKKLSWPYPKRKGIVHRLDKETSGILLLAKNPETMVKMQKQFQNHTIEKIYLTLVLGKLQEKGEIKGEIARDSKNRRQKVAPLIFGKPAKEVALEYKTKEYLNYLNQSLSLAEVNLKTGRTHQIRAQMKTEGYPVIGDPLYFFKPSRRLSQRLGLSRQFLHAYKIKFTHPETGAIMEYLSKLPRDLEGVLGVIKGNEGRKKNGQ